MKNWKWEIGNAHWAVKNWKWEIRNALKRVYTRLRAHL